MAGEASAFLGGFTGSTIGSAVVKLFLDSDQYNAEMARTAATGQAATSKMSGTLSKFKQYGALAFAAVGTAAVAYGAQAVAAAREHEVAVQQLTAAVGEDAAALIEQANALQMTTGFSDEAIMQADTLLAKYDLTAAELSALNPLVLDYARFTGQDAATAAGSLGKALLGNTRALKAVGVEYEATGNRTKDLATLMAALQEKVGGTAVAFGKTSAGQAEILRQKLDELSETIGNALLPVIAELTDMLLETFDGLDHLGNLVSKLSGDGEGFGALGDVVRTLTSDLNPLVKMLEYNNRLLYELDARFGGLAVTAQPAEGAIVDLRKRFEDLGLGTQEASRSIHRFADKSKKELGEFKEATRETFTTADDVFGRLAERSRVTAQDVIRAFRNQNKALRNYAENVREVKNLGLEDDVLAALSELGIEGAVILEGLSTSSKREIEKVNRTFDTNVTQSDKVTTSITGVGTAMGKLDGRKAKAEVIINYSMTGINPSSLPGLKEAG